MNKKELNKKMRGLLKNSASYFNLAAILTGLCISTLFIYIAIPGEYNLTLFESVIVFFLTISSFLFISSVILFSFTYEKVNRLKQESNQNLIILEKKINLYQYDLNLGRKCTIAGLCLTLTTIFYLIYNIDLYLGGFTVISSIIVLLILAIIRINNFKRANLTKIKNGKKIKINKIRLLIIIVILIISVIITIILDLFFK